jgi:aldose 1-epimerase
MHDPISGRTMEILTQEPALQFYAGNFMDGTVKGKAGNIVKHRYGIALETQNYPDAPNQPNFPNSILAPGETYSTTSVYRFGFK